MVLLVLRGGVGLLKKKKKSKNTFYGIIKILFFKNGWCFLCRYTKAVDTNK